jgi:Predicted Co/Zn/Cd cation transporters
MHQKKVEQQALKVGIVVNIVMVLAGFFVFFLTGLKVMFLDASFTVISVISGGVAAYLSKKTVRVSDRFPNGMFALEPIYAICKSIFTICLLLFSFLDVLRVAIDYFAYGEGERLSFGPVIIYQIASLPVCLVLVGYYRARNRSIGNASLMLKAEANGTWIDGMISLGIGIVAVLLYLLPSGTPFDFLHYTGDFFITTIIVLLTIKEPVTVLRDAFVELVGGTHDDEEIFRFCDARSRDASAGGHPDGEDPRVQDWHELRCGHLHRQHQGHRADGGACGGAPDDREGVGAEAAHRQRGLRVRVGGAPLDYWLSVAGR